MKRLIVFDLDNTLAKVGKGTLPGDVELLKELEKKDVHIAICSGKPTFYLCGYMRQLGLENPILIGENGAVIQFGVDLPPVKYEILPYSKEAKATIRFLEDAITELLPHVWYQPNEVGLTPFLTKDEEFDVINKCIEDNKDKVNDVIVYQHFDCFDITPNGITKSSGIDYLAKMLGLEAKDVIAVGDGINDYPMFEYAGLALGINVVEEERVDKNFPTITEALKYILQIG